MLPALRLVGQEDCCWASLDYRIRPVSEQTKKNKTHVFISILHLFVLTNTISISAIKLISLEISYLALSGSFHYNWLLPKLRARFLVLSEKKYSTTEQYLFFSH